MRSPEDMKIIEIDITNACVHSCSNCTRMCGHHKKPYFMSWETFKRAVDSMDGFEGGVSMMGGEPTLHPEFERFAEYLNSKYETPKEDNYFIAPTANFMRDRKLEERNRTYTYQEKNGVNFRVKGPVFFSSIASNYYKYYETIQDVFRYQGVNDHSIGCFHQPIMVARKDMGVPDEEWTALRDKCWIQNRWSASITPKGCFFCEIAGALDMLFDGPGGWPIEPGWWKRKPEDFKDQLHWCELCGAALNTRSRDANEEIDDASETLYKMLEELQTPRFKKGRVNLYTKDKLPEDEKANRKDQYHDNNYNRLGAKNKSIYPDGFVVACILDDAVSAEEIKILVNNYKDISKKLVLCVHDNDFDNIYELYKNDSNIRIVKKEKNWGRNINRINHQADELDQIILISQDVLIDTDFVEKLKGYVFNPGTYHYVNGATKLEGVELQKEGYLIIYTPYAMALRKAGFDRIGLCNDEQKFRKLWDEEKIIELNDNILKGIEPDIKLELIENKKYVVYGIGAYGKKSLEMINKIGGEVIAFVDSDVNKQNVLIEGVKVYSPDAIHELKDNCDYIVIGALAYNDIKAKINECGVEDDMIIAPIF